MVENDEQDSYRSKSLYIGPKASIVRRCSGLVARGQNACIDNGRVRQCHFPHNSSGTLPAHPTVAISPLSDGCSAMALSASMPPYRRLGSQVVVGGRC